MNELLEFEPVGNDSNIDDFFKSNETNATETPELTQTPEAKETTGMDSRFISRVIFNLFKSGLNTWSRIKTGDPLKKHGFDLSQDEEDFCNILTDGFDSGSLPKPPPALIIAIFLISFFTEPVVFLITYKEGVNNLIETETEKNQLKEKKKRKPHREGCQCVVCKQKRQK